MLSRAARRPSNWEGEHGTYASANPRGCRTRQVLVAIELSKIDLASRRLRSVYKQGILIAEWMAVTRTG